MMLKLNDGRNELWQWDTARKLAVDADCSQVHFSNKVFGRSIDADVVDGVAIIPDVLLQTDKDLTAWAFVGSPENGYTKISKVFKVNKRNKPANYVFTPTEQTTLGQIMERLDDLEAMQDPDAIKNAVDDYLANNPIQIDEKDPTVPAWAKQATKPKYTATEVGAVATVNGEKPDANGNVEITIQGSGGNVDLTGYATEEWVQDQKYLTEVPEGYAKTEDIPTVPTKVSAFENDKNYLTQHQDISGKLDASALPTAINTALAQAKASGEFDGKDGVDGQPGKDGYTPQKNIDYFDGEPGQPGQDGSPGKDGSDGVSATHSWNGTVLTVTSASGTSSADLKGEPGKDGSPGTAGKDGASVTVKSVSESTADGGSNVVTFSDGKTLTVKNGSKGSTGATGSPGSNGADGVSPTVTVSKTGKVTTISITDKDGKKTATINDGADGSSGSGTSVVSTFAELKAATLANVTPIVLKHGVTIEATEMLTFQAGTTLIGNGATIKRVSGHENKLLYLHRNCRVQDLVIDGNRSAMVSPTWQNTADIATSAGCVIDNVTINEGNEAICVYGDNCVITNCNINNCGGNGIHFSGSNNTRVENCRVINANLRSGMGHEDGCIIWSNECEHIVCSNNWCEGGIAGFGSIDAAFNSHVKLIGNTVKNCTVAVDLRYQNKAPHDIVITGNTFIDSGKIDLYKDNSQIYVPGNIVIDGNLFINTDASFFYVTDVTMNGNIFKNGCPSFKRCARVTITNNTITNAKDTAKDGIFANSCHNVVIEGNYVRAHKDVLNVGYSTCVTVRGNNIRNVYSPTNTDYCINCNSVKNLIFDGNTVVLYRKGMSIPSYASVMNNVILCVDSSFDALMLSSGTNALVKYNRINGGKSLTTTTGSVIENNDIGASDDVFVSVTNSLTNLTADMPAKATKGDEFAFTLVPNEGSTLPETIAISNNGIVMDVNEYEYDSETGAVLIHCVSGALIITAETESALPSYRNRVANPIEGDLNVDGVAYDLSAVTKNYQDGLRLSSSGATKTKDDSTVSGYIRVNPGDVIRIAGVEWYSNDVNYVCAYDSSLNHLTNLYGTFKSSSTSVAFVLDQCSAFNGTDALIKIGDVSYSNAAKNIAYIRVSSCGLTTSQDAGIKQTGANMIVTVNEEIT